MQIKHLGVVLKTLGSRVRSTGHDAIATQTRTQASTITEQNDSPPHEHHGGRLSRTGWRRKWQHTKSRLHAYMHNTLFGRPVRTKRSGGNQSEQLPQQQQAPYKEYNRHHHHQKQKQQYDLSTIYIILAIVPNTVHSCTTHSLQVCAEP